jgi:hypothetical protein
VAAKLALGSRTEIALFALRNGLVQLNDVKIKRSFRASKGKPKQFIEKEMALGRILNP